MITKTLKDKILLNKIEITQDNINDLWECKDITPTLPMQEFGDLTHQFEFTLSPNFYYITQCDLFIIDFTDPRSRILFFYSSKAIIQIKKDGFVDVHVSTKIWTAKVKWFYPKTKQKRLNNV
jgi:hypothetical protein